MVRISVVTVVLNAADCIEQCITSVLNQSYKDIEYLVIDGGSTDGTIEIINSHKDRLDHFVSEPDGGIYHAMNKGITKSTGDYIYFMNSDDCFCDERVVADVASIIKNNPFPDLVYGDVLLRDGDQLTPKQQAPVLNRESLCRKGFCHQALFSRRETMIRTGGFSTEFSIVADGDWLARALASGATSTKIDRCIAIFSLGGFSETSSKWREEKRRSLRKNFTRWELFWWRKVPGLLGRMK